MDDTLETPRPRTEKDQDGDEHSSGDEDGGLDWTKLPKLGAAARPIIPKRGEKDFEPAEGAGSGLQLHVLDRSRGAMFEVLRANRTISSKAISYGIWYPFIDRVHVTTARGIHFSTMGHFISRTVECNDTSHSSRGTYSKPQKQLELLPEEALYLIERGALFCYKSIDARTPPLDPSISETRSPGEPMSVQQAFSEMIGREGITLERYQVYAYLKRLGFMLMRAEPPSHEYPVAPPVSLVIAEPKTLPRRLMEFLSRIVSNVINVAHLFHRVDWWRPLQPHLHKKTSHIFEALRFIPCGHAIPLHLPAAKTESTSAPSPYKIFFNVYKPSTPFRKTAPPAPDFHVVVINARTTPIPSLQELTALFNTLPEMPFPPPRKRGNFTKQLDVRQTDVLKANPKTASREVLSTEVTSASSSRVALARSSAVWTFFRSVFSFLPFSRVVCPPQAKPTFTPPKSNPFLALKTGKKTVVVAAVDAGNISFFKFGQGAFEEWPML